MKSNYTSADLHSPRRWGFRLSHWDAAILLFGVALTLWLRSKVFPLWWIVPVGVGHFFLFCNVFLVWRRWELVWAVLFVAIVLLHTAMGNLGWWPACGWQMPVTFFVIFLQLRSPWYPGILARRINPRLDNYLNGTL